MRNTLLLLIIFLSAKLSAQNGQYVTNLYVFYDTQGQSQWTEDNPLYTKHKFIIDIQVSNFSGKGEITIKDLDANTVVSHSLSGKLKEFYDKNTEQYALIYSSTLNAYGSTQLETVNLVMDVKTGELNSIITTSVKFRSSGNYIGLQPLEETLNSTGSGFIITNSGYIITNYHVVKGAKRITVKGINGDNNTGHTAILKKYDKENDIALLKIQDGNYNASFNISSNIKDVGESIFVLGYPMISVMGTEIKLTDGVISSLSGYLNNKSYYQISAPIQPGNSGCPLFDSNGNLIGLVSAKLTNGENVGYALKSPILNKFLLANGISASNNTNTVNTGTLSQKIKLLKPNIIFIESFRQ